MAGGRAVMIEFEAGEEERNKISNRDDGRGVCEEAII